MNTLKLASTNGPDPALRFEKDIQALSSEQARFPRHHLNYLANYYGQHGTMPTWPIEVSMRELERRLADGGFIVLIGDHGRGKTTLATLLVWRAAYIDYKRRHKAATEAYQRQVERDPRTVRYVDQEVRLDLHHNHYARAGGYIEELYRRGRYENGQSVESIIRADARNIRFLVLDELQLVPGTDADANKLDRVIDERYAQEPGHGGTILISNQTPAAFQSSIRARNISRLMEKGVVVECCWKNLRGQ